MPKQLDKPLIAMMAGGTGGHIFPGLVIAKRLCEKGAEIIWLGARDSLEHKLASTQGYMFEAIQVGGLRGKKITAWLSAPWLLSIAFWRILRVFFKRRPALVIGMGGFVSGPGGVAAFVANIPLLIHEQNAIAGLTNRLLAPLSQQVLTGFPNVLESKRTSYVGNPVRFSPAEHDDKKMNHDPLHLLVIGGSLGASIFNETVSSALNKMASQDRPRVKQQCGRGKAQAVQEQAESLGVAMECFDFDDRMEELYRWADVVLCRAGAMTLAEVSVMGIAAIIVPFPFAVSDHQTANARFLSENGAAILISQKDFSADILADTLSYFSNNRSRLKEMSEHVSKLAIRDSGERIANICCEVARI